MVNEIDDEFSFLYFPLFSVSSPSPPRPLPRASLATISGGQTSPVSPPPPIPSHHSLPQQQQQHPLNAIAESSSLTPVPHLGISSIDDRRHAFISHAYSADHTNNHNNINNGNLDVSEAEYPPSLPLTPRIAGRQKGNYPPAKSSDQGATPGFEVSSKNNNHLGRMERKQKTAAKNESSDSLDSLDSGVVISELSSKPCESSLTSSSSSSTHLSPSHHQHHHRPSLGHQDRVDSEEASSSSLSPQDDAFGPETSSADRSSGQTMGECGEEGENRVTDEGCMVMVVLIMAGDKIKSRATG